MRLLLDTHILIWAVSMPDRLSPPVRAALETPDNDVLVSAASAWEIAIKQALGRLTFPLDIYDRVLDEAGFAHLPILAAHGIEAGALPRHHADPFDRLLIAQARVEALTLVTADAAFMPYDVRILGRD